METISYFFRYLIAGGLSFLVVVGLTLINHFFGPMIWPGRIVERYEVFFYSVFVAGPLAFVICFLFFFYGIDLMKQSWPFAKMLFTIACVLAVIGIIVDIICLPKMR